MTPHAPAPTTPGTPPAPTGPAAAAGALMTGLGAAPRRATVAHAYRAERRKLRAQLSTRVLALGCALAPLAFAAVLAVQGGVPSDTLFGVWVHTSGFAVPLVILGFTGMWGFPVVAGILAGDLFSGEDRHGTWKTLLTRGASRRDVFAGKVLAVGVAMVALVAIATVSSLVAGLVATGHQPLVDLSGTQLGAGRTAGLVVAAWATSVVPALGFVALAVLCSVLTRSAIGGALGPVLVALATQLLDLVGNGTPVHAALLGSTFSDWHGLLLGAPSLAPLVIGTLVGVAWTAAALGLAWAAFARRDFAGPATPGGGWGRPLRLVLAGAVLVGLLAAGTSVGPATITPARLQAQLTPTFDHLLVLQQRLLGHQVPADAALQVIPQCSHRGGTSAGPGDDWTCTLEVFVPEAGVEPFQQTPVTYDMSVQADGCYKAEAPPSFVGQQLLRDARGRLVVNPLYVIYGCFESAG